jgi:hypothetical protein
MMLIDVWTKRYENKALPLAEKGHNRVKFKEKEKQELYVDGF